MKTAIIFLAMALAGCGTLNDLDIDITPDPSGTHRYQLACKVWQSAAADCGRLDLVNCDIKTCGEQLIDSVYMDLYTGEIVKCSGDDVDAVRSRAKYWQCTDEHLEMLGICNPLYCE